MKKQYQFCQSVNTAFCTKIIPQPVVAGGNKFYTPVYTFRLKSFVATNEKAKLKA